MTAGRRTRPSSSPPLRLVNGEGQASRAPRRPGTAAPRSRPAARRPGAKRKNDERDQPARRGGRQAVKGRAPRSRRAARGQRRGPSTTLVRRHQRRGKMPKRTPWVVLRSADCNRRMKMVFGGAAVALLVILAQVIRLQTVSSDELIRDGRAQSMSERRLIAQRGSIIARGGVELAITVPGWTVIANPKEVTDPIGTSRALAGLLGWEPNREAQVLTDFERRRTSFVYLERQVDPEVGKAIDALGLAGVSVIKEPERVHPAGTLALPLLGRTDIDGTGIAGLEKVYDDLLAGINGAQTRLHDSRGRTIAGDPALVREATAGSDLVITIDPSLQYSTEQALLRQLDATRGKGGMVVVIDTASGDLLAVANASKENETTPARLTTANLAAVEAHDPGSVAKAFTVAAALDAGTITEHSTFMVPDTWVFDKGSPYEMKIADADPHPTQSMSVRRIVQESSNIGTMLIADQLGTERLRDYHARFGFGRLTTLGFPNETAGVLKAADKLRGSEKATVAYGYGYTTSSLQLAAAMNAIANGGMYVQPRLVSAVIGADGSVTRPSPGSPHRVISAEAAKGVTSLLKDVVCKGTGRPAQVRGVSVAGKTGTAFKVLDDGTYGSGKKNRKYFSSFVGFLPADRPQVTILVSIDEPLGGPSEHVGGRAAGPLFASVAEAALRELRITPVEGDQGCPARRRK